MNSLQQSALSSRQSRRDFSRRVLWACVAGMLSCLGASALGADLGKWGLQDDAANTTVVGSLVNGTLVGGDNTAAKSVAGLAGDFPKAISFNGTDDGVQVAWSSSNAITVTAWVKLTAVSNFGMLVSRCTAGGANGNAGVELRQNALTGQPQFLVDANGNRLGATFGESLVGLGWVHLAGTYDGAYIVLYVDGDEAAATAETGAIAWGASPQAGIGYRRADAALWSQAAVMDVRVMDAALNEAAIEAIIAESSGGSALPIIIQLLGRTDQRAHFNAYGVYALAP